jgi:hypothetical protein
VRLLFGSLLCFLVAGGVGLGTTWFALNDRVAFGGIAVGAWQAWPKTGTTDIDPYARASLARSGTLPLSLGDGVAFTAQNDDGGHPLDGRCDLQIKGTTPAARFWTLTLYDPDGQFIPNSLERHGFTSEELIRKPDGSFDIMVAPRARPGNWLPTGGAERYVLMLRLYDTPVGIATRSAPEAPMPTVTQGSCQ